MSHRYRFDLESNREVIRDDTGVEADDQNRAIEQAEAEIEEMRASGELPDSDDDWELVIRDEAGDELKRIPL